MVTGLDLVALQFLVASGNPLPFSQDDVRLRGHSIEARVNAEDPAEGRFTPTPGPVTRLSIAGRPWVRTDARVRDRRHRQPVLRQPGGQGGGLGAGPGERPAAAPAGPVRNRGRGHPTTIPAHMAVLSHPDFIAVRHSTTWLSSSVDLTPASRIPPRPAPNGRRAQGHGGRSGRPALRRQRVGTLRQQPGRPRLQAGRGLGPARRAGRASAGHAAPAGAPPEGRSRSRCRARS